MRDRAIEIGRSAETDLRGRNAMREYLQHVILREWFDLDVLEELIFHGGTGLRILHDHNRFSEDLDFHTRGRKSKWNLLSPLEELQHQLEFQGYTCTFTEPSAGNVTSSFVKFEKLLYESDISSHESEKLQIKIEVDTNPPEGFTIETSPVHQFFPYVLHHHDRSSFLAGKCHAILQRSYAKGRDYFDLFFYRQRWPDVTPNFVYLRNALEQTDYEGPTITPDNWKSELLQTVKDVDWDNVKQDVEPFLERPSDLKAFRKEFLTDELKQKS